MQKKVLIVLAAVVLVIGVVGGLLWFRSRQTTSEVSPTKEETSGITPTQTEVKLLTWNDPAGFTFQYDPKLKIDNHPEDQVNYANLEIKQPGKEGKITVMASDTKYTDLSNWVKKDKIFKDGSFVNTTLGGKEAKKVLIANSKKVVVGTIDDEILFTIELDPTIMSTVEPEENFYKNWEKFFEEIVSSFKFVTPTVAPASTGSGESTGSDVIEEEEIIE